MIWKIGGAYINSSPWLWWWRNRPYLHVTSGGNRSTRGKPRAQAGSNNHSHMRPSRGLNLWCIGERPVAYSLGYPAPHWLYIGNNLILTLHGNILFKKLKWNTTNQILSLWQNNKSSMKLLNIWKPRNSKRLKLKGLNSTKVLSNSFIQPNFSTEKIFLKSFFRILISFSVLFPKL